MAIKDTVAVEDASESLNDIHWQRAVMEKLMSAKDTEISTKSASPLGKQHYHARWCSSGI